MSGQARTVLIWAVLIAALVLPLIIAASSPLQTSRNPAYIVASLSGVIALALLVVQPLVAAGYLRWGRARQLHRWLGAALVLAVGLHVGGLYLTSPMDALDALLLVSPTPFSVYGVTAMWAVFATALLAIGWRRIGLGPRAWRGMHTALAIVIVGATVVHAVMIEGAMGTASKWMLCGLAVAAIAVGVIGLRRKRTALR